MPTPLLQLLAAVSSARGLIPDEEFAPVLRGLATTTQPGLLPLSGTASPVAALSLPGLLGAAVPALSPLTFVIDSAPAGLTVRIQAADLTLGLPGTLTPATVQQVGAGARRRARYTPQPGPVRVRVSATWEATLRPGARASLHLTTGRLDLIPRSVLLPAGFGITLLGPVTVADALPALEGATLALPADLPVVGGLEVPIASPTGLGGTVSIPIPTTEPGDGPRLGGRLEWSMSPPTAATLATLVPTGGYIDLTLPGGQTPIPGGPSIAESITVRTTFARAPADGSRTEIALSAFSDGPRGLTSGSGGTGDKALGAAVVLAPAVAAATGTPTGASVAALLTAAGVLVQRLLRAGGYTVHAATLDTSAPTPQLELDVSGYLEISDWNLPGLSIQMDTGRPLRVRWRRVRAELDLTAPLPDALRLDFSRAVPDVVDPGGWRVRSPHSLLEIVGTRSGAGSTWFEVDLRFRADLGPIRVSGATVRATVATNGAIAFGLRGLQASLTVPGLITGEGKLALQGEAGFEIAVAARILPLGVGAFAVYRTAQQGDVRRHELAIGADLPVPVPLGPTALALYGVMGAFGANAAMPPLVPADPLGSLRAWKPWSALETSRGNLTFGAGVVIGTAFDHGFTFSALGVLGVTAPDVQVRLGVDGKLLANRWSFGEIPQVADRAANPPAGLSFFGGISIGPDAVTIGVIGSYRIPSIVEVNVPLTARFPFSGGDWWLHAGSDDGVNGSTGRPSGPVKAVAFPDTPFSAEGWAFLMIRGNGIPNLAGTGKDLTGVAVAVGVGFSKVFGVRGVLWAQVHAEVVAAIATTPALFWGEGSVRGTLGVGPFHIGVSATLTVQIGPGDNVRLRFQVCGEISLVLTTLRRCLTIGSLGEEPELPLPTDEEWPFPAATLADGVGRPLALTADQAAGFIPTPGSATGPDGGWAGTPVVWPDAIPLLSFPVAPRLAPGLLSAKVVDHTGLTGSGRISYTWTLTAVILRQIDADGAAIGPAVPLTDYAWQPPTEAINSVAATGSARQLALLTRDASLWTASLSGLPGQGEALAQASAAGCTWSPSAGRAWTLGARAHSVSADPLNIWYIPPEPELFGPAASLSGFSRGTALTCSSRVEGGGIAPVVPHAEGPTTATAPDAAGRSFPGVLRLRSPRETTGQSPGEARMVHTLTLAEAVIDGDLWLLLESTGPALLEHWEEYLEHAAVYDTAGGVRWVRAEVEERSVDSMILRLPVSGPGVPAAVRIELRASWVLAVAILGLHAMTARDAAAAAAAAQDATAQTDQLAALADGAPGRTMLAAGARYRITVAMTWTRTVTSATGQAPEVTSAPAAALRHWYLRTAPAGSATTPGPWASGPADPAGPLTALLTQDRFDPRYLERYLTGFTPADHSEHWFTADPLAARFGAPHLPDLLAVYGREVRLAVRRVDRRAQRVVQPRTTGTTSTIYSPGSAATIKAQLDIANGCPQPPNTLDLTGSTRLHPNATYELSIAFPTLGAALRTTTPGLPGGTFRTSGYTGPTRLIEAFGFGTAARILSTGLHGWRVVDPAAQAGLVGAGKVVDDARLEDAVDRLGLGPLVPVAAPRSTALWQREDSGWSLTGILLESPEPLERGARMSLVSARVGGVPLNTRFSTRSGSIVLWLVAAGSTVRTPGVVLLTYTDRALTRIRRARVSAPTLAAELSVTGVLP